MWEQIAFWSKQAFAVISVGADEADRPRDRELAADYIGQVSSTINNCKENEV